MPNDSWDVFDYEVEMYFESRESIVWVNQQLLGEFPLEMLAIKNAVAESVVLHTRVLIELLLSKSKSADDICIKTMLPEWWKDARNSRLISELANTYGSNREVGSPCWIFNKMLAHATRARSNTFDYGNCLNKIEPKIVSVLVSLREATQRKSLLLFIPT